LYHALFTESVVHSSAKCHLVQVFPFARAYCFKAVPSNHNLRTSQVSSRYGFGNLPARVSQVVKQSVLLLHEARHPVPPHIEILVWPTEIATFVLNLNKST